MFRQGFTCPALLNFIRTALSHTGLSPSMASLSRRVLLKPYGLLGWSPFARRY